MVRGSRTGSPTGTIIRFPQAQIIWVVPARGAHGGWLALAPNGHGWSFGCRHEAERAAAWLSRNFGLPIRRASS